NIPGEVRIDLQQVTFVVRDHTLNGCIKRANGALEFEELRRQGDRGGRRLLWLFGLRLRLRLLRGPLLRLRTMRQGKQRHSGCTKDADNGTNNHDGVTPCKP